jgi:hypothetical protein
VGGVRLVAPRWGHHHPSSTLPATALMLQGVLVDPITVMSTYLSSVVLFLCLQVEDLTQLLCQVMGLLC